MITRAMYEQIAEVLKREAKIAHAGNSRDAQETIAGITEGLIEVFERDNDRFDIHKFEKAAGRGLYF